MHTVDQFARYLLVTQRVQSDPENNILNMRESKQQYNFLYIKRLIHGLFAFPPEVCLWHLVALTAQKEEDDITPQHFDW
jgi:hypothetical protein